ncbi:MAG: polymerase sigma-70 factor, subfamily, partial [Actinomycetota bacterium]|nr:polymerase sigma-70 factor, subfamily [Actinomycetota bacterium]
MSPTTPAADGTMTRMALRRASRGPDLDAGPATLDDLLHQVARGDSAAFELLYDRIAGSVFGVIRRVLRDPAQSEEVAQEVLVEVWRTATRFDADRGSAS